MVMRILAIRPNPRELYQKQVASLCNLLKDKEGRDYRVSVFRLLTISAKNFVNSGCSRFRQHPRARHFLHEYPADTRALEIMDEIDTLYSAPLNKIDQLRGAVGEVFSYFICRKLYNNADIEVKVEIDAWLSKSIDTAGCTHKRGHCLQSKYSMSDLRSVVEQKSDFDAIEQLTSGKAQCFFITYVNRAAFLQSLNIAGIDPTEYTDKVFDRSDLLVLEERLTQ